MKYNNFTFLDDKLLCWRLGPISAVKQKHFNKEYICEAGCGTHKPPISRGFWAFPYPHYDLFFCWHQWEKHLPKKYRKDSLTIEDGQEKEKLLKIIQKKFKPSLFYADKFYSHIFPNGKISYSEWFYWDCPRQWTKEAIKGLECLEKISGEIHKISYSKDHLEIFIP